MTSGFALLLLMESVEKIVSFMKKSIAIMGWRIFVVVWPEIELSLKSINENITVISEGNDNVNTIHDFRTSDFGDWI